MGEPGAPVPLAPVRAPAVMGRRCDPPWWIDDGNLYGAGSGRSTTPARSTVGSSATGTTAVTLA